jgi:hypothetical protein
MSQTYTTLLELKAWLNSVVADDLHRVILEGTTLKLVTANKPDLIISEFVVPTIEPPVVEDVKATSTKASKEDKDEKELAGKK